jgi:surfeit locus 1 family protein
VLALWTRLREAGLQSAVLWMIPALSVLIALGTWQLQRKAWKDGLIGNIKQRVAAEPVDLDKVLALRAQGVDLEYIRVQMSGHFTHGQERFVYAPGKLGPGYHVYTPLTLAGAKRVVLVNRGFVPEAQKDRAKRPEGLPNSIITVTGLVRIPGKPGWFTPASDQRRNIYFYADLAGMVVGTEYGAVGQGRTELIPVFVDAQAEPGQAEGVWPRGGTTYLDIPNRHLDYAATWYGLALTLIGVFAVFARGKLKGLKTLKGAVMR